MTPYISRIGHVQLHLGCIGFIYIIIFVESSAESQDCRCVVTEKCDTSSASVISGRLCNHNDHTVSCCKRVKLPDEFLDATESDELNEIANAKVLKYESTWESLDSRPLPTWFDQSKIGIFITWGVYSVPALDTWFWYDWKQLKTPEYLEYMNKYYRPDFTYQDFAPQFTAEFYNATEWVELFKKAGAKYVVLTSKHCEGYTLWPSKYSFGWNAMDIGPHRDLVQELADAVRSTTDLRFGLYHVLYEWFNPLWLNDLNNSLVSQDFVNFKTLPALYELVNTYKPELIWSDGDWDASDNYWKSKEFLTWLYNESPVKETVLTNDRWGTGTICKHGGYFTCQDRYNPGVLQPHKWENCLTLDKYNWGFRKTAKIQDYLTPHELIQTLVETVACGGNFLINVGPTKEGLIVPIQQERLLQLGEWLNINGEAIYGTVPWKVQNDTLTPGVWYTQRPTESKIYAISISWPISNMLRLQSVNSSSVERVEIFGWAGKQKWTALEPTGITITMPPFQDGKSQWAWTVAIQLV